MKEKNELRDLRVSSGIKVFVLHIVNAGLATNATYVPGFIPDHRTRSQTLAKLDMSQKTT